jgi:hypothetical protein
MTDLAPCRTLVAAYGPGPLPPTAQALQLLDFLIKHGSTRVATDSQSRIFRVQTLTSFSHFEEGVDQGTGGELC